MLTIKLKPQGRKYAKHYRISVFHKTGHPLKKSVEDLGHYNPYTKEFKINQDRLNHYIALNIEMSETVTALLKRNKLLS
jgi:small subunit ribosomal protein S16